MQILLPLPNRNLQRTTTNSQSFGTIIGNQKIPVTLLSIYNIILYKTAIPKKRKRKGNFNKLCEDNNNLEEKVQLT